MPSTKDPKTKTAKPIATPVATALPAAAAAASAAAPRGPSLIEIGEDFRALDELLDETEGEITPEIEAWFAELEQSLTDKLDGYASYWRFCLAREAVCLEESERFRKRAKAFAGRVEFLKLRLMSFMAARGTKKLETDRNTFSVRANGGVVPLELPADHSTLPPEFVRLKPVANTDLIRETLEAGGAIDGCRLKERGEHLRLT